MLDTSWNLSELISNNLKSDEESLVKYEVDGPIYIIPLNWEYLDR